MPALVYPTGDFVPFTKILSSEVNGKFNAITALLNTTKLNSVNVQTGGLLYNNMTITTSLQIVGTDSAGVMTTQPLVLVSQGGLGFAPVLSTTNINQVVQVNSTGTALTLGVVPAQPSLQMYNWNHFF